MKTFITKTKNYLRTVAQDAAEAAKTTGFKVASALGVGVSAMPSVSAFAGGTNKFTDFASKADAVDPNDILDTILSIIKFAGLIIGVIFLAIGGLQFAMAFRNEDAEGKTKASHVLIAGLICCCIGGLMTALTGFIS